MGKNQAKPSKTTKCHHYFGEFLLCFHQISANVKFPGSLRQQMCVPTFCQAHLFPPNRRVNFFACPSFQGRLKHGSLWPVEGMSTSFLVGSIFVIRMCMSAALHHVTARALLDDPVTSAARRSTKRGKTGGSEGGEPQSISQSDFCGWTILPLVNIESSIFIYDIIIIYTCLKHLQLIPLIYKYSIQWSTNMWNIHMFLYIVIIYYYI